MEPPEEKPDSIKAEVDSEASTLTAASRQHVGSLVVIPDHELIRQIGSGSYGDVWLAKNAVGTLRAVKIVHSRNFERQEHFEREFKGLQRFEPISRSHDGFVDILQLGRNDSAGYFYYVMELADGAEKTNAEIRNPKEIPKSKSDSGKSKSDSTTAKTRTARSGIPSSFDIRLSDSYTPRTLRHALKQEGSLPVEQCVQVGLALTAALEHLHAHGLVHRDIKPSNIIFVNGAPKLADIGLVTDIDEARSMVGTAGYIPPEGPGAPQADIYSLGKVLYEISLGKDRHEFPQLPPDLQTRREYSALLELNEVVIKACESDPRKRYQSAAELGTDLELLQTGKSVKCKRTVERRWGVVKKLGLAGAAVALVMTAWIFLKGHTPDPEAADLYEMGRWQYNRLTGDAHEQALKYLTQAVEKDPKFTQPYGELMALYTWNMLPGITNELIRLQKVQEIADKALAINPNSAEGHMALSWCRFLKRDWRGAEAEIRQAIKLSPKLALAHGIYCFYLSCQGRIQEAHREGKRAVELEPPDSRRATALIASWPFIAERRFDGAIAQLQRVLELDRQFAWGYLYIGDCYQAQSNYVAAIEAYQYADLLAGTNPDRTAAVYSAVRQAYDAQGEQGYFRKWIEVIHADDSLPEPERMFVNHDIAGCYARLGEKEKALAELEKHFDEPQWWHQIKFIPLYDSLHDEPRFKALVKRAGLEK